MQRSILAALLLVTLSPAAHSQAQELTEAQQVAAAQAVALLDEAVSGLAQHDAATLRRAINTVVPAYHRAGQPEKGRTTLYQFLTTLKNNDDVAPHLRTSLQVSAVLQFANLGFPGDAAEVATSVTDENYRWSAMVWVVYGYARAGELDTARTIAAQIPEASSRDRAYQYVAYECLRRSDFACASSVLDSMTDSGLKTRMIGTVARAKSRQGLAQEAATDLEKARRVAAELPDEGEAGSSGSFVGCVPTKRPTPRDSALKEVAATQAGLGQFQAARESLSAIQDSEVREDALVALSGAAAQQGDFTLALSVAGEVARPECRSDALSWIALFQFRAGDAKAAHLTIAGIPVVGERVHALMNIASSQRRKDPEAAAITLSLASEVALQIVDELERLDALLQIARRQFDLGSRAQVLPTLLAAQSLAGGQPESHARPTRNRDSLLRSLAALLAETGDLSGAAEIARRMSSGLNPTATIARGATRGGHLERVRAWAHSLPLAGDRSMALAGIAIGVLDRAGIGRTPSASIW